MSARSQALVPLSTAQQPACRAVPETEKGRHKGNTLAEYRNAGAFSRVRTVAPGISLFVSGFFW
ncbi:plasmid SOS inhibition protein A, partial [Escherichia coli]